MSEIHDSAGRLADYWLTLLSDTTWEEAAASIHEHLPRPCGETTQITEGDSMFDVSDSWEWVDAVDGDIRLTVEVFDRAGSDNPKAIRETLIRRG